MKKYIPPTIKVLGKQLMRKLNDCFTGMHWKLGSTKDEFTSFPYTYEMEQTIMPGLYFNNKVHNISRGANAIHGIVLQPEEVFSFWHILGRPNARNGYQLSRNIIAGKVGEDYGGGLCQLASIVYFHGLQMGFQMHERYHHSVDIYQEEDRFTPLGADSAVVYAYKDLRFKNHYPFPIRLRFEIVDNRLFFRVDTAQEIKPLTIYFEREELNGKRKVKTFCQTDTNVSLLSEVTYQVLN
jgi:vancomycin resistance protein VanW